MNKFISKYSNHLIALAVIVSTYSINMACGAFFNQPQVPNAVKKLRKF